MEKLAGCGDGGLDTTRYASPMPIIGLYIAVATLVCFFSMAFDLVYGLFIRRKPYLPCKLFSINSFTLTLVAVATKIPVDLTTSMPRSVDQLSKLTGTALLCISLGFFMPSLGIMSESERYSNMAALSIMVITMIVNVCIQMVTGVIFVFKIEHIIIMVCMLLLLILLWSSTLSVKGHRKDLLTRYSRRAKNLEGERAKGLQGLRPLLEKYYVLSYSGNPQSLLCQTTHCYAVGLLCAATLAVVLEVTLRSFVFKELKFRTGISDYGWSILLVIMAHIFTIIVGGFTVISRGLTMLNHMRMEDRLWRDNSRTTELQYWEFQNPSFKFPWKRPTICQVIKNFIVDVLIKTQDGMYIATQLVVIPFYWLKKFLEWMVVNMKIDILFRICVLNKHTRDVVDMVSCVSEIINFVLIFEFDTVLQEWIWKTALEDMVRWMKMNKRDSPTHLIQLLSKTIPHSQCTLMEDLQVAAQKHFPDKIEYEYRVSCISVLVLARLLGKVAPSLLKTSVIHSLHESFQIIYFIDQKTNASSSYNELRWIVARDVWEEWDNPNHWFQTKVVAHSFRNNSENTSNEFPMQGQAQNESKIHHALGVMRNALENLEGDVGSLSLQLQSSRSSLDKKNQSLMNLELVTICKFILEQKYVSIEELYNFMEIIFVEMLHFLLSRLTIAILKEVDGDPYEVGEERVRNAMKFLSELELLNDYVKWSWPTEFDTKRQNDPLLAPVSTGGTVAVADDNGSELEANVSSVSTTQDDGNIAAPLSCDDDEIINEDGFDAIV